MIMWTVQPMSVYRQLQAVGRFHCDEHQTWSMDDDLFEPAYRWMAEQMTRRVGPAPREVTVPIWGWYRRDWQHKRPDFRSYRDYPDQVCLEVDIPEDQVLLSDFEEWNCVLNDGYLFDWQDEADFDRRYAWFNALPAAQRLRVKQRSWQRVFEIDPVHDENNWQGRDVQGCFWELQTDQVRHALRMRRGQRMVQLF